MKVNWLIAATVAIAAGLGLTLTAKRPEPGSKPVLQRQRLGLLRRRRRSFARFDLPTLGQRPSRGSAASGPRSVRPRVCVRRRRGRVPLRAVAPLLPEGMRSQRLWLRECRDHVQLRLAGRRLQRPGLFRGPRFRSDQRVLRDPGRCRRPRRLRLRLGCRLPRRCPVRQRLRLHDGRRPRTSPELCRSLEPGQRQQCRLRPGPAAVLRRCGYNDWKIKLGHFYTPIGYEVVPANGNFFYTHAYTMQYGEPFTHTGVLGPVRLQRHHHAEHRPRQRLGRLRQGQRRSRRRSSALPGTAAKA